MLRNGVMSGILIFLLAIGVQAQQVRPRPDLITPAAESAIEKGQAYLARTQNRDGSWTEGGSYGRGYPVTMSSMAVLALMSGGHTPTTGKYADKTAKTVEYLLRCSGNKGVITSVNESSRSMYGHGFATLALAHAYGMESDPLRQKRIKQVLDRAVMLIAKSQSKDGGWYYTPESSHDEGSVTVTQIQALRACRDAGINVPPSTIKRADNYIFKCANKDGGISYALRSKGRSLPAITAAATATMYNTGKFEHKVAIGALNYTKNLLKKSGHDPFKAFRGHTFYSILYFSQAMWFSGDKDWKLYFPKLRDRLVRLKQNDGSWKGDHVGNVYGTSIALLTLQLPYRALPILQR